MRAYKRLLKYVTVNTTSHEEVEKTPSGEGEFVLAHLLADEMKSLGMTDVHVDEHAYVYGFLPAASGCEGCRSVGFISHMDTVDDCGGTETRPQLILNYDGKPISLGTSGKTLDPDAFPHLKECRGKTILTTDGTSVLGADDKAGIAEIMTMCERLVREKRPHGRICVCFTPDEEIGHGAVYLDVGAFGADFAYTVDGSAPDEVEYETFNAAAVHLTAHGFSVHPGDAKGRMINAMKVLMEFNGMLPPDEVPEKTEGREGFYHLTGAEGNVSEATADYILRDHDAEIFDRRKQKVQETAEKLNQKYGAGTVDYQIKDQYRNMAEVAARHPEVVEIAKCAIRAVGLTPVSRPVRGGTDGAQLSFRGLPCPNLGTGGYAYHGYYEHAVAEEMDQCVEILLEVVKAIAEK
ncbi:tripeptide aminopeptidase [Sarcina sp. DSM 11001]|uniref:peptidase T n=1 Tax=Sarcina sp. DSM 11001 TaxID=1798184 RepID=UPI0008825E2D|nr:peptidase T [Sarcina sp. DSM 11001]SDK29318.1 tripeptide aminopeptidase [Sarcina sp. DSM 11001]